MKRGKLLKTGLLFWFWCWKGQSRDLEGAQVFKMVDDLVVFGDDFKAIWGILGEDEALEEKFTVIASDVSWKTVLFGLYSCCIDV